MTSLQGFVCVVKVFAPLPALLLNFRLDVFVEVIFKLHHGMTASVDINILAEITPEKFFLEAFDILSDYIR